MKQDNEEIVYSEITGKRRPPSTVSCVNEPNFELMAKAFLNLYYQLKEDTIKESATS